MLRIAHIYIGTISVCCMNQNTEILFRCNLLCSRAEFFGIVRIAKALDFNILFVLYQKCIPSDLSVGVYICFRSEYILTFTNLPLYRNRVCYINVHIEAVFICISRCLEAGFFTQLNFLKQSIVFLNYILFILVFNT